MTDFTLQQNVDLTAFNTMALPCQAEYFCDIHNPEHAQEAANYARQNQLAITVIGGGSNIILPAKLNGLVIHVRIPGIAKSPQGEGDSYHRVNAGAGENWHQLVTHCLATGSYGLENLALIPGSCGAAPIQNIGAYGVELESVFDSLRAVHIESGEMVNFDKNDCQFHYRDSIFKHAYQGKVIITEISLRLSSQPHLHIEYPALKAALEVGNLEAGNAQDITPQRVAETVCEIRKSKLPDPETLPNVGSFFKNPIISSAQAEALRSDFPNLVSYPAAAGKEKLAAAWLIDQLGWKGHRREDVGVHSQQALVLINHGNAKGDQLLALANDITETVRQRFGVTLEIEPQRLGG